MGAVSNIWTAAVSRADHSIVVAGMESSTPVGTASIVGCAGANADVTNYVRAWRASASPVASCQVTIVVCGMPIVDTGTDAAGGVWQVHRDVHVCEEFLSVCRKYLLFLFFFATCEGAPPCFREGKSRWLLCLRWVSSGFLQS